MSQIHVIYNGNNDIEFTDVFRQDRTPEIQNPQPNTVTHEQIKRALSIYFDVNQNEFDDHYIEINPNGNITVRPNAKWGG